MDKRNIVVRIIAILLCVIMVLGVGTAALTAFAAEEIAVTSMPDTGSPEMVWVIVAVVAAVAVIAGCLVIPKVTKKK